MNGKKNQKNIQIIGIISTDLKGMKMKKIWTVSLLTLVCMMFNFAFAADIFDALGNLTPEQKRQMSNIYNNYQIKNNELLTRILSYTDKIANLQLNSEKTKEQIALLTGAYERNISTLKNQQEILQKETDALYQLVLTSTQYKQFQELQQKTQDAFNNFLQK